MAIEAMEKEGNFEFRSTHLTNLGTIFSELGQAEKAIDVFTDLLAFYNTTNDKEGEAICLNNLGVAYRSIGDLPNAIAILEQGVAKNRQNSDKHGEALALGNLGLVFQILKGMMRLWHSIKGHWNLEKN